MKVFLSWSGERSRAVAELLRDWLPRVIQAVKPFYSPEIEKGAKWSNELDEALEGTRFGIVCLTPDNLDSAWIHYEAGALSKTKDALIWTFLHGLTPGDVRPPLGKFQHTAAEKADVLKLVQTINARLAHVQAEPLDARMLEENFELFWPKLKSGLEEAEKLAPQPAPPAARDKAPGLTVEKAMLEEILELSRSQERRLTKLERHLQAPAEVKAARVLPQKYRAVQAKFLFDPPPEADANAGPVTERLRNAVLDSFTAEAVEVREFGPYGYVTITLAESQYKPSIARRLDRVSLVSGGKLVDTVFIDLQPF